MTVKTMIRELKGHFPFQSSYHKQSFTADTKSTSKSNYEHKNLFQFKFDKNPAAWK